MKRVRQRANVGGTAGDFSPLENVIFAGAILLNVQCTNYKLQLMKKSPGVDWRLFL